MARTVPSIPKDFLSVLDFEPADIARAVELAIRLKRERALGRQAPTAKVLEGRHVALVFDKPSLRTRVTFEVAIHELGGEALMLGGEALGRREPVVDVARNLERWIDAVVIRTFSQMVIEELAQAAKRLHVINALTDEEHPCQAVTDVMTLHERWGALQGRTLAFVGDGNNVAASLAHVAAMAGMHLRVASPDGYQLPQTVVDESMRVARDGGTVRLCADAAEAVAGADAIYTDTWTSMGQEGEAEARRKVFRRYQVNAALMAKASPGALFMHCLPAHRGEEVTSEVFESDTSVVFEQAENRLHAQKALLLMLMAPAQI